MTGDMLIGVALLALIIGLPLWAIARLGSHQAAVTLRWFQTREAAQDAQHVLAGAGIKATILDHSARYSPLGDGRKAYLLSVPREQADTAERVLHTTLPDDGTGRPPA